MQKSYLQENPFEFAYRVFCNVSLIFFSYLKLYLLKCLFCCIKDQALVSFQKLVEKINALEVVVLIHWLTYNVIETS